MKNQTSTLTVKLLNNKYEKLLGVKIDQNLNINVHVNNICKKAGQKLSALFRITSYRDFPERLFFTKCLFYLNSVTAIYCTSAISALKMRIQSS